MSSDSLDRQQGLPDDNGAQEREFEDTVDTVASDFAGADFFHEIENVSASDWDVDSDALWGAIGGDHVIEIGDDAIDPDIPM